MAKESDEIKLTACDHDDGCCDDAHEQYREHVDAGKGECQNENIGDELHQVVIGGDDFMGVRCKRNSCNNHDCGDGCGERNPEVLLEFVLHFAALRGSRCDSRVGNEREVITEHGSANHGTHAEGNAEPCCPGNFKAIGATTAIVPTDVPMAVETNAATTKSTTTENCAGIKSKSR